MTRFVSKVVGDGTVGGIVSYGATMNTGKSVTVSHTTKHETKWQRFKFRSKRYLRGVWKRLKKPLYL